MAQASTRSALRTIWIARSALAVADCTERFTSSALEAQPAAKSARRDANIAEFAAVA
jgi:hypothetical protein